MAEIKVEKADIITLFTKDYPHFLIPDYQRPYAWTEEECQTLWDDIFTFAIPEGNSENFNPKKDMYFLGPIVTFENDKGEKEVIDGQQRLTTLMLLLRAFYSKIGIQKDPQSVKTAEELAKCLWEMDEDDNFDKNDLKIDSEVASDDDKDEFLNILRTGEVDPKMRSKYANNYRFFISKIDNLKNEYPGYTHLMPRRIMKNCILLPIEAESQETALRIFSTLNDRGLPLSDSDIFKAQLYKYYTDAGKHDKFVERWKNLEELANKIFHPIKGTPMDELFTRYMYFERAKARNKSTTTEALRNFYGKDSFALLKEENTFDNLEKLANFWKCVDSQDDNYFSERVLRRLFVLNYAPNGMWAYFTSVYYMQNADKDGKLDDEKFYNFLNRITAFIWTYAITNPGVNALRTPLFAEMINIVDGKEVTFSEYLFNLENVKTLFNEFKFLNSRPITRSMLAWWAFTDKNQKVIPISEIYEIEHIYPRNRQQNEKGLIDPAELESLGNKALLEKRVNIRASDYRFEDKKKYYVGFEGSRGYREGTNIYELHKFGTDENMKDFTESDIMHRHDDILFAFYEYLKQNRLIVE